MTTTNLGRVAIVPKGTYTAGTNKPLDLVRYQGASYLAKTTTSALPTVTTDWDLIAADGSSSYTWVKYADDAIGTGLSDSPTGKAYIGFATNKSSATESTTASDYSWSLIKGDKGDTGLKGDTGTISTVGIIGASIRPSLLLDFANSKTLDPRITFTRASTATYTGYDGLIKTAASGQPRFDFNPTTGESLGLLIEEQRTNLLTYSEQFDKAAWNQFLNTSITPNSIAAPDGTLTADTLTTNAATIFGQSSISITTGGTYSFSIFVKKGNTSFFRLRASNGANSYSQWFNLDTNSISTTSQGGTDIVFSSSAITNVGNDWKRVSLTCSTTVISVFSVTVSPSQAASTGSASGDYVYIWGAQLEAGAFPTSYIPSSDSFTSRASVGSFIGSNGLIQLAATNVARYNYNPLNLALSPKLLLEPASTNLLTYSEQFDNAAWTKSNATITANATTAPDGTLTADKLVENTANAQHYCYFIRTGSNETVTVTVFAKAAERSQIELRMSNFSTASLGCDFDLTNGIVGTIDGTSADYTSPSASISNFGNGWYRCSLTVTKAAVNTNDYAQISLRNNNDFYTGDGTSGIFIWGAQLEAGTSATSYIQTVASQVTRAADVSSSAQATRAADSAVMTGTNFSSWYRQDEGTVFVKQSLYPTSTQANIATFDDGTGTWGKRFTLAKNTTSLTSPIALFNVNNSGTADVQIAIGSTPNTTESFSYKANDYAFSADGLSSVTDASASVPTGLARLVIGASPVASAILNGTIAKLAYYPKRLTNAELQSITTV